MITEIISELKQGYDALEKEDFSKANEIFDNILKKDKKNANAYVGKLLAENKLKKISDLEGINEPFSESINFKNAILYGQKDIVSALEHCVSSAQKRKEKEAKRAAEEAVQKRIEEEKLLKLKEEEEEKKQEKQKKLEKEQEQIAESIRENIKKGKKKKLKFLLSLVLLFAVLISCSAFFVSRKIKTNREIEKAQNLYNEGNYAEAYLLFLEIGAEEEIKKMETAVKDISKSLAEKGEYKKILSLCNAMKTDVPHLDAYKKVEEGKYKEAVSLGLSKFVFPSSEEEIPSEAFCDCAELEEIIIPEGIKKVGAFSFEGCVSLKKVTLPLSLEAIEENAFHGCFSLSETTIPKNVSFIGRMAFSKCNSLSKVSFMDKNEWQINGESYSFSTDEQTAKDMINNLPFNWIKNQT